MYVQKLGRRNKSASFRESFLLPLLAMAGSGLQWSFSGKPGNPPQILSFKPASEGISHSIYPPGFVQNAQKAGSADKNIAASLVNRRQAHSYGAFVNHSRDALKVSVASDHSNKGQLVASPLNSPSPLRSNTLNGIGCRVNPESLGSAYKVPSSSVPPVSSAVVGSTNLRSGEGSCNGPSQMTIFYDGLVCVYDDVAPDKAQAIMLLAGNGNSRSRKPAEPAAKAHPHVPPSPPAAMEVNIVNPSPVLPKPIPPAPLPTDLSDSSSSKVSETSSGLSKATSAASPKDPVSAGGCTSKVEVNPRNLASKFPTSRAGSPASNHIRLSQSAIPIDPVSASASPSTVEVNPRIPSMRYSSPTPGPTGTHRFRFSQSAIRIDPVLAGASVSKLESPKHQAMFLPASNAESPKHPASKFPTPTTAGCNQIRFSQSYFDSLKPVSAALPTDSVSARASTSRLEASSKNPAPSKQISFSQSALPIDPVSAGASSIAAVEVNPKKSTSNFPLPATGATGSNQIHFSPSAIPCESGSAGAPISIVESNPMKQTTSNSGSKHYRFLQSATPLDPASAGASTSIVESNPVISTAKFPDPATSSGSHKFRFSQSGMALPSSYLDRSMPGSSTSDLKKPNSSATPTDRASPGPSSSTAESSTAKPASKISTPAKGSGEPSRFRFSQSGTAMPLSYLDRSIPGSSNSDLKKPNSSATPTDRASPGPSSTNVESSAAKPASKISTTAKGSGEPSQLRFSQSGVPLARKASLARFLEKRKERPSIDVADLPPCKFRSNSG